MQASADEFWLLTDAAPVGIFQTDAENRYIYTNPRWSEITGIPPEAAAGQVWGSMSMPRTSEGHLVSLPDTAMAGAELSSRVEIEVPDSGPRMVVITSKAIADNARRIVGWVGTLTDVTAEAEAEAAMSDARDKATEASRLKSDFLANMSHEIRTPMNGVIGMTDLLLETDLDARQRDYAQTVRNSGEALMTIINDILDFSKVEAGKLQIEEIDFRIRDIVGDVVDLLAGPAQSKGLELVAVIERPVPAVVRGDPGRVRQVLTNLIGNAIKFTEAGEIVVRVVEAATDHREVTIRFEVTDTGDGIAPEMLQLVFQPFVQADTSTSRRYGGTGLGLAISSQLVSLMGGDCGVDSELGSGSAFWFTICVHADTGPGNEGTAASDPDLRDVPVLIVDDSAALRIVLSEQLSDWGMNVAIAGSGEAGLAMLRTSAADGYPFRVALIDRSMPGMDGVELKSAIVADPGLNAGLVLMLGLGQERDLGPVEESGVSASLFKPVHLDDLRTCLRVALGLQPPTPPPSEAPTPNPSAVCETRGGRLLLAEDNRINQKVAVAILTSAGYQVDTVFNGKEAVRAAERQSYDAILMDCQMPEMDGYEATAAIRAQEGSDRHTPIIAMTAGARREDRERCLAEGMDSYPTSRPVGKDALLALLLRSIHPITPKPAPPPSLTTDETAIEATIDPEIFDELRLLGARAGEDLVGDVTDQFIRDTEVLLVQLRDAFEVGDAFATGRIAHTIRGSSIQLGGRQLAASCAGLESQAVAGSLPDDEVRLKAVETDYRELRRELTAHLASGDQHAVVPS